MSALWLGFAFFGGMAFMWKVGGRLLWFALGKRSLLFEQTLGKLDYVHLVRMRFAVDREIVKRVPPRQESRPCPHPSDCTAEGCAGTCDEPVTRRMRPGAAVSHLIPSEPAE